MKNKRRLRVRVRVKVRFILFCSDFANADS